MGRVHRKIRKDILMTHKTRDKLKELTTWFRKMKIGAEIARDEIYFEHEKAKNLIEHIYSYWTDKERLNAELTKEKEKIQYKIKATKEMMEALDITIELLHEWSISNFEYPPSEAQLKGMLYFCTKNEWGIYYKPMDADNRHKVETIISDYLYLKSESDKEEMYMPLISQFYGILIYIHERIGDRNHEPHFLAKFGDFEAIYDIESNRADGELPRKQNKLVEAWALLHQDEINAAWIAWNDNKEIIKIEGLK